MKIHYGKPKQNTRWLKSNEKWNEKFAERLVKTNPKTPTIRTKILFESPHNCSSKEANIKQLEETLKQKENTIGILLKSNIEDNKKFTENNQNHKTNETEIHNSIQQEHDYVMKQNAKASTICQPVTKTKTLNDEKISTKITENITQNSPNINPSKNNTKTNETISETADVNTM